MKVKIVDTTLRDGEQKAGIALGLNEKVEIAKLLDMIDIDQIEAGIPAMGGDEKRSIQKIVELGLNSTISTWNRINTGDIQHSLECASDIIHISAPSSDLQIKSKLKKDRQWVVDNLKRCVNMAAEKGYRVTVGLEDASRADFRFLLQLIAVAYLEGAERVRYADTVGLLHRQKISNDIKNIREELSIDLEIHAHNDLGMAVSNSIQAVKAGVEYVDCTMSGIGERAGNCDYIQFIKAAKGCLGIFQSVDLQKVEEVQDRIMNIVYNGYKD